jgi:nucleoside-diphosphate-sugar epimerase
VEARMKALVMGGTGAIGASLVRILLERGYEVDVTTRNERNTQEKNLRYIKGDAHDLIFLKTIFEKEYYDYIVDFMTYTADAFYNNVDILLSSTAQYIFLSSARVYADSKEPLTENSVRLLDMGIDESLFVDEPYALNKAKEEDILKENERSNWTIVRPYLTYNNQRLQLGFYEKEYWLYRILNNRTLLFPADIALQKTTLTFGDDVAKSIADLLGKEKALGEIYGVCTDENLTWNEVLIIYVKAIKHITGKQVKISYTESYEPFLKFWSVPLIEYDRNYNRRFNNDKLINVIGKRSFVSVEEGLNACIEQFIKNPVWKGYYHAYEAWSDAQIKESTFIWQVPEFLGKIKYLKDRYFVYNNS